MFKDYFFASNIATDSVWVRVGLWGAGALLLVGIIIPIIIYFYGRHNRQFRFGSLARAVAGILRTAGLVWLILFALRYEEIDPFVQRSWVYLLLIGVIGWLYWVVRRQLRMLPDLRAAAIVSDRYEKYLPKPKKTSHRRKK